MNKTSLVYIAPIFRVTDMTRSLAFYRDQLDFAVEFVYEGFYAGVCREGCHIHLKCSPSIARDQLDFERKEHVDICIRIHSAEALSSAFISKGVPFVVPLRDVPYGKEFYIRDPDGYVLGLVEAAETSQ